MVIGLLTDCSSFSDEHWPIEATRSRKKAGHTTPDMMDIADRLKNNQLIKIIKPNSIFCGQQFDL